VTSPETPELSRKLLSVVVPCFNEQDAILLTHQRLVEVLGTRPDFDLEIVYVDDGSSDDTPHILTKLQEACGRVAVLTLTRNFGHQAAVTAGLQHASGDAVVVIDADLQDPPEVILDMFDRWQTGYDVVYGIRKRRREMFVKRLSYRAFYRLLWLLSDIEVPENSGDFALLDRRAVDALNSLPERVRF
jgi:polyisoprenyl-phosphate glycosyltransferase